MSPTILVVDDERQIRRALRDALTEEGYRVMTAETAEEALGMMDPEGASPPSPGTQGLESRPMGEPRGRKGGAPDLILLDLGLPGMSGLEFCRAVRGHSRAPIIVLSVRSSERDKVTALDLGADDYLTKPFGTEELLARVRAHLRRWQDEPEPHREIRAGDVYIDLERREVRLRGEEVKLTRTQYEILRYLALNAGRVVTHGLILQNVWGSAYEEDVASLRVHITHLRRKIETDSARPRYILTELGVGYRFVIPETGSRS
jgi:two-component system KDP operon response regulator KdpE